MPPESAEASSRSLKKKALTPKIGDVVRYSDPDGGKSDGESLVGKITFLTKASGQWLAEVTQLEDLGDGFVAEYSSRSRMSKKTDRWVTQLSPVVASFVRTEQAYKVPLTKSGAIQVVQESYDLEDWEGPAAIPINEAVLQADGEDYQQLKLGLLKNAALTGLAATVVVDLLKGTEDAVIYFMGVLASLGYLFFLSIKTDTLASPDRKLGANVSNLRFVMPVLVIVGVALYVPSLGDF